MSDDLRTRIAAVLKFHYPGSSHLHLIVADAVIANLGLTKASPPDDYRFFRYPSGDRYITNWLTDE